MPRAAIAVSFAVLVGCGRASGGPPDAGPPSPAPPAAAAPSPELPPPQASSPIHGRLETREGQTVLRVWGTPREMGFAHGYLLRDRIVEVIEGYALDVIPGSSLTTLGQLHSAAAFIPTELRQEAEGVIEGMEAAGGSDVRGLERSLRAEDILLLNAMTDLLAVGCSSLSSWGSATEHDASLFGATAVVRNLDWSDDPELLANQVIIVYAPSDPGRMPVVSVAFAGYLGCLSCINEAGVTALFNMGYGAGAAGWKGAFGFAPANLLIRDALERRDPDGDGHSTAADLEHVIRQNKHVGSYILHVLEPSSMASHHRRAPARVLEVESDGIATRHPDGATPLGPSALAATNHLREKSEPRACSRYTKIEKEARKARGRFGRESLWKLGRSLRLREVVHTMLIEPDARTLELWLRAPGEPAGSSAPGAIHSWDALLDGMPAPGG